MNDELRRKSKEQTAESAQQLADFAADWEDIHLEIAGVPYKAKSSAIGTPVGKGVSVVLLEAIGDQSIFSHDESVASFTPGFIWAGYTGRDHESTGLRIFKIVEFSDVENDQELYETEDDFDGWIDPADRPTLE